MKLTIRYKFIISLTIIFIISFVIFTYFADKMIDKNNEKIIKDDLINIISSVEFYINQEFLIHHIEEDDTYFKKISDNLTYNLYNVLNNDIYVYDAKGILIASSNYTKSIKYEDIEYALNNDAAYTIDFGDSTLVYFSVPITSGEDNIGVVRIAKDYTQIYNSGKNIIKNLIIIVLVIFLIIYISIFIVSSNIITPVTRLSNIADGISKGKKDYDIKIKRKDEIGTLYQSFSNMVDTIDEQMDKIKKDRDQLIEINSYRKSFFDNVAHELKTPLTTIIGYSQMIAENGFTDEEFFSSGMTHILGESKRLQKMVLELIEISKETSDIGYQLDRINISEIIKTTCEEMKIKAKRYTNLINVNVNEDFYVQGDKDKLKGVIINLLDNAIKYSFSNTAINVEALLNENEIHISIQNKGKKISDKEIEKIFIPFYRVDKKDNFSNESNGLGLAICKSIIDYHNGDITINCSDNNEITVTIILPSYKKASFRNKIETSSC